MVDFTSLVNAETIKAAVLVFGGYFARHFGALGHDENEIFSRALRATSGMYGAKSANAPLGTLRSAIDAPAGTLRAEGKQL